MLSGHRYGKQKIGIILTTERNAIYDEILQGVQGIVITPIHCDEIAAEIDKLIQHGVQVVTVNTDIQNTGRMAYVGCHHKKSGVVLAELLGMVADGRQMEIGIVSGPTTNLAVMRREKGFLETLQEQYPHITVKELYENEHDFVHLQL